MNNLTITLRDSDNLHQPPDESLLTCFPAPQHYHLTGHGVTEHGR
jgi:hypothetical protein